MSQLTPIRGKIQRGKVAELLGRFERGDIEVNEAGKDKVDLKRLTNIKDCLKSKKQRTPGQKEKLRKKNLKSDLLKLKQLQLEQFFRGSMG